MSSYIHVPSIDVSGLERVRFYCLEFGFTISFPLIWTDNLFPIFITNKPAPLHILTLICVPHDRDLPEVSHLILFNNVFPTIIYCSLAGELKLKERYKDPEFY
jgi:hypothetical protein